ncbi:hypothetical protein [Rhodoplanes azumiensis]|uniref:Uncharacterized protein n=1 Tax=Rhodoplanes azumiensis TaxID=1897628 RepID=A0ABW5AEM0_9BRAD
MDFEARRQSGQKAAVIPGRGEAANPESSRVLGVGGWIPGPTLRAGPE